MKRRQGLHEDFSQEEAVVGSSDRSFGLILAAGLALLGGVKLWGGNAWAGWWFVCATAFLVVALVRPTALAPLNRLWLKLGLILSRVVNPLVMGLLFYLCVLPIGLLLRLLGKDLLRLKYEPQAKSYWIERQPPGPAPDTIRNQF